MYSTESAEDSEKERTDKGKIGKVAKKRFEAMLRVMSGKRAEIARAMEFAMNKAEAADDVGLAMTYGYELTR
jgi:U2-associated protein SR140